MATLTVREHTLLLLSPPSSSPPESNNTLPARSARARSFNLDVPASPDASALPLLFNALFSTYPSEELFRIRLPASSAAPSLKPTLLASGLALPLPTLPDTPAEENTLLVLRETFWQGALAPEWALAPRLEDRPFPLTYTYTEGRRHPVRAPKPGPGTVVYRREIPHLGETFTLRVVDPECEEDVRLFNAWQNSPRVAAAWNETGSPAEHAAYLARQTADAHQLPLFGEFNGQPFLYTEVYWVREDHIAPFMPDAHDFDRGYHLLVGEERFRGAHRVQAWLPSVLHYMFLSDARTQRLVSEPRASNDKVIKYMISVGGFAYTKTIDFPHKRSALLTLERERFFQRAPFAWEGAAGAA